MCSAWDLAFPRKYCWWFSEKERWELSPHSASRSRCLSNIKLPVLTLILSFYADAHPTRARYYWKLIFSPCFYDVRIWSFFHQTQWQRSNFFKCNHFHQYFKRMHNIMMTIISLPFVSNSISNQGSLRDTALHILLLVFIPEWNLTCSKCVSIDESQISQENQPVKMRRITQISADFFLLVFSYMRWQISSYFFSLSLSLRFSPSLSPPAFVAKLALDQGNISSSKKSEYLFFLFFLLTSSILHTRAFVRLLIDELSR